MSQNCVDLASYIRDIDDWPKPGIIYKDITPLLADAAAFSCAVRKMADNFRDAGIDYVAAVDARGFIFGAAVAIELGIGFVPVRKKGKLPSKTESATYDLEYGTDCLEIHIDAVKKGSKVLMVDDLLATGGTMAAACELIEKIGGSIEAVMFLIELKFLNGSDKLKGYKVSSLIEY